MLRRAVLLACLWLPISIALFPSDMYSPQRLTTPPYAQNFETVPSPTSPLDPQSANDLDQQQPPELSRFGDESTASSSDESDTHEDSSEELDGTERHSEPADEARKRRHLQALEEIEAERTRARDGSTMLARLRRNLWNRLPDLRAERSGASLVAVNNLLYSIGGSDDRTVLAEVDMADSTRSSCEWIEAPSLNIPRTEHAAVCFNGTVWVCGGFTGEDVLSSVEVLRPGSLWAEERSMDRARTGHALVELGGHLYAIGGIEPTDWESESGSLVGALSSVSVCDAAEGVWRPSVPMTEARYRLGAAVLDGRIYVTGGFGVEDKLSGVESWAPGETEWRSEQGLPLPRAGHCAVTVGGRLYVLGGQTTDEVVTASTESFAPSEEAETPSILHKQTGWRPEEQINTHEGERGARRMFGLAVSGGGLFVAGGMRVADDWAPRSCRSVARADVLRYMMVGEAEALWAGEEAPDEGAMWSVLLELAGARAANESEQDQAGQMLAGVLNGTERKGTGGDELTAEEARAVEEMARQIGTKLIGGGERGGGNESMVSPGAVMGGALDALTEDDLDNVTRVHEIRDQVLDDLIAAQLQSLADDNITMDDLARRHETNHVSSEPDSQGGAPKSFSQRGAGLPEFDDGMDAMTRREALESCFSPTEQKQLGIPQIWYADEGEKGGKQGVGKGGGYVDSDSSPESREPDGGSEARGEEEEEEEEEEIRAVSRPRKVRATARQDWQDRELGVGKGSEVTEGPEALGLRHTVESSELSDSEQKAMKHSFHMGFRSDEEGEELSEAQDRTQDAGSGAGANLRRTDAVRLRRPSMDSDSEDNEGLDDEDLRAEARALGLTLPRDGADQQEVEAFLRQLQR